MFIYYLTSHAAALVILDMPCDCLRSTYVRWAVRFCPLEKSCWHFKYDYCNLICLYSILRSKYDSFIYSTVAKDEKGQHLL